MELSQKKEHVEERKAAIAKLWDEGVAAKDIAKKLGYTATDRVYAVLKQLGLKTRASHPLSDGKYDDVIKRHWPDRLMSMSQLARLCGGVNPTSIAYRAQKIGLPKRQGRLNKSIFDINAMSPQAKKERQIASFQGNITARQVAALPKRTTPATPAKPLRPARTCKWIEGEYSYGQPDPYCGARVIEGKSYCARHAKIVFETYTPKKMPDRPIAQLHLRPRRFRAS